MSRNLGTDKVVTLLGQDYSRSLILIIKSIIKSNLFFVEKIGRLRIFILIYISFIKNHI